MSLDFNSYSRMMLIFKIVFTSLTFYWTFCYIFLERNPDCITDVIVASKIIHTRFARQCPSSVPVCKS